jgi:hypothetical protein
MIESGKIICKAVKSVDAGNRYPGSIPLVVFLKGTDHIANLRQGSEDHADDQLHQQIAAVVHKGIQDGRLSPGILREKHDTGQEVH